MVARFHLSAARRCRFAGRRSHFGSRHLCPSRRRVGAVVARFGVTRGVAASGTLLAAVGVVACLGDSRRSDYRGDLGRRLGAAALRRGGTGGSGSVACRAATRDPGVCRRRARGDRLARMVATRATGADRALAGTADRRRDLVLLASSTVVDARIDPDLHADASVRHDDLRHVTAVGKSRRDDQRATSGSDLATCLEQSRRYLARLCHP